MDVDDEDAYPPPVPVGSQAGEDAVQGEVEQWMAVEGRLAGSISATRRGVELNDDGVVVGRPAALDND